MGIPLYRPEIWCQGPSGPQWTNPDLEPNLAFSDAKTCVINHFHIELPSLHLRDPKARGQLPTCWSLGPGLQGTRGCPLLPFSPVLTSWLISASNLPFWLSICSYNKTRLKHLPVTERTEALIKWAFGYWWLSRCSGRRHPRTFHKKLLTLDSATNFPHSLRQIV